MTTGTQGIKSSLYQRENAVPTSASLHIWQICRFQENLKQRKNQVKN